MIMVILVLGLKNYLQIPELQDWIKHVVRTTFDDTTYLEQNDAQYALSLMLDYASPRIKK